MSDAYRLIGEPKAGGVLIVCDHASNRVPADIDLGIAPELLESHIAWDIGAAAVARLLVAERGWAAWLGNISRLVCDLNRERDQPSTMPLVSDGHAIPGNVMDDAGREARLRCFYDPYHQGLAALLQAHRPGLIVSIHSFTPRLSTDPGEQRPWEIGVLYNEQEATSKQAIALLAERGFIVGDQLPYSGQILNATMNVHAEANGIPYFGVELRQDIAATSEGQARFADALGQIGNKIADTLASGATFNNSAGIDGSEGQGS